MPIFSRFRRPRSGLRTWFFPKVDRTAQACSGRAAAAKATPRQRPSAAPKAPLCRTSRNREDHERFGSGRRTSPAVVHDHARRSDHEIHGRDRSQAAPGLRQPFAKTGASISLTNSTPWARIAISPMMSARSAACSIRFCNCSKRTPRDSLIVAATNHRQMLDRALFRRFDDVIEYSLPDLTLD